MYTILQNEDAEPVWPTSSMLFATAQRRDTAKQSSQTKIKCLIDSGSRRDIVSEDLVKKQGWEDHINSSTVDEIIMANGERQPVVGELNLPMCITDSEGTVKPYEMKALVMKTLAPLRQ